MRTTANTVVAAALGGLAFSGVMLTFNDVWGFGQEPYRMWIDSITVSLLLLAPLTAWSIARLLRQPTAERSRLAPVAAGLAIAVVRPVPARRRAPSAPTSASPASSASTPRATSRWATVTADVDGLMTGGPCVDPQILKIASRKPVAFYNLGIAWPENRAAIDAVVSAWNSGTYDPDALRAAKVRYLVTDSACGTQWPVDGSMGVIEAARTDYADATGSGTLTLWRIA